MAASTNLTPEQRSERGRLAALSRWSKEDRTTNDASAQVSPEEIEAYRQEILAEQGDVPEPELTRRAIARRRMYIVRSEYEASKRDNRR